MEIIAEEKTRWLLPVLVSFAIALFAAPVLAVIYSVSDRGVAPRISTTPMPPYFAYLPTPKSTAAEGHGPSIGRITQGTGSAFSINQQGGVTAGTINIGEQPRVITPEDKEQLKSHLQGFHSKVSIGVDVGARDGMQLASQLQFCA